MLTKGSIKALLRLILRTTLGAILGILGLILRVLGGAQSALDYKEAPASLQDFQGIPKSFLGCPGSCSEEAQGPFNRPSDSLGGPWVS